MGLRIRKIVMHVSLLKLFRKKGCSLVSLIIPQTIQLRLMKEGIKQNMWLEILQHLLYSRKSLRKRLVIWMAETLSTLSLSLRRQHRPSKLSHALLEPLQVLARSIPQQLRGCQRVISPRQVSSGSWLTSPALLLAWPRGRCLLPNSLNSLESLLNQR